MTQRERRTGVVSNPVGASGPRRGFFDVWSRIYDFPLVQRATYRPVHNAVLRALRHPRRVLDVGCGTGQLARRVKVACPAAAVVGCDFSGGMLHRAASGGNAVHWVRGDAAHLPFDDGVFDAVVSTEAFHWFPDQDAALAECFRVLAPGGRLLLALVNTPASWVSDAFHLGSRLIGEPFYWPSTQQLRERVRAAGFRIRRQHRIFRVPGFLLLPVLTEAVR
jgi:ubiquinone/menaquinone biosynthesis C-methylase UbiE